MKSDQASEENLMGELDRMYQDVADIESCEAQVEHRHNPNEPEQISEPETSTHAKIIPFPGHRTHLVCEEPSDASEEESSEKRKPSYRPYLIVASFSLIVLVFVLVITAQKGRVAPPASEKREPHQLASPVDAIASPPAQAEEDLLQNIKERQQKAVTGLPQTFEPNSPFSREKRYAIQVGAFRNWENASERIDALRKMELEPYWIEVQGKSRRIIYVVFSGYFSERNEAAEFLKRKDILSHYPDSYVREISFSKK